MDLDGTHTKILYNWQGVDEVYAAYEYKIYFIPAQDTTHRCYFLYEIDSHGDNFRKISNTLLQNATGA